MNLAILARVVCSEEFDVGINQREKNRGEELRLIAICVQITTKVDNCHELSDTVWCNEFP